MERGLRIKDRPIVFFDLETTSLDTATARIVEIAAVKIPPKGKRHKLNMRIRPGIPIPVEVTKVHGISTKDVEDCPLFEVVAREIHTFFTGCDLAGFNVIRYDIPVLLNNFKRVGLPLDISGVSVVDVQRIFHMREPRDLSAAVAFYTDRFHVGAHSALADTEATIDVLIGQLAMYEDLPDTVEGLSRIVRGPGAVDMGGKLILSNGEICFAFGKHNGEPVWAVPTHYLEWVLANVDLGTDAAKILHGVMADRDNKN